MSEFPIVGFLLIFLIVGSIYIFVHLLMGKLLRPDRPHEKKGTIYECGEPTIGSAWVQFDLRYYVIALLFVIFDVEVAFFFPWATVFGKANDAAHTPVVAAIENKETLDKLNKNLAELQGLPPGTATITLREGMDSKVKQLRVSSRTEAASSLAWLSLFDILIFFGVLLIGFAYLWRRGDLAWVRAVAQGPPPTEEQPPQGGQAA